MRSDGGQGEHRVRGSALMKAFAVLDAIAAEGRPLSLAGLTERLDLPKPTLHRVILQLEEAGLLRREPARDRFSVGPRLGRLAFDTTRALVQAAPVHAVLEDLVGRIDETCNIGILDGTAVRYLDRVECNWALRLQLQPNSRLPAHCTAIGKLLLAALGVRVRKRILARAPLEKFTGNTITDAGSLEAECRAIGERDYALNDQEYHLGLVGLAVPVRDRDGRVLAGLAVHGPIPRLDIERALGFLPDLRDAAGRLGAALDDSLAD